METVERSTKRILVGIDLLEIGCASDEEVGCCELPAKPLRSLVLLGVIFEKSPDSGCVAKLEYAVEEVQL